MEIQDKVKEIKKTFHLIKDGAVAKSMRDKGLEYGLNWGGTLPRLREMAEDLKAQSLNLDDHPLNLYCLAIELWKENVRECMILATMIMPPDKMMPEICDIWMERVSTQEIAEQTAFNLWQYLPYAPEKAFQWLASDHEYYQLCGFHVLTRLFMNGQEPNERGVNEFIDQALIALQGPFISVRKAAMQSILRFAELGLVYERLAKSATKSINLDIF